MKNCYFILFFLGLVLGLSACSSHSIAENNSLQKQLDQREVLSGIEKVRSSSSYTLQPGDLVEIQVFKEEDMTRTLRLSGNGNVTFPLVGNVNLAGNTLEEAEAKLAKKLTAYLRNPQVSMLVKEYGNKTVYVLGQVKNPSSIEIPPEKALTVLEAISSVGGFTDIANTSKVRVLRMEDGKQKSMDVDVAQITKQGNKSLDIALMPGDVVFVPQSMF